MENIMQAQTNMSIGYSLWELRLGYTHWHDNMHNMMTSFPDDTVWYAIIDPNADSMLTDMLWIRHEEHSVFPIFLNTLNHESMLSGPLITRILHEDTFTNMLIEKSKDISLGIFYNVHMSKEQLFFDHLQNLVECSLPQERKGVFRFYDPRVLFALCQCGDSTLKSLLVGPALSLHAWEPGHRQGITLSGQNSFLEHEGFFLEQMLLDGVSKITMPYAVIQNMQGACGEELRSAPLEQSLHFVKSICDALFIVGVTDIHGCIVGTSYAMQIGKNIFENDAVKKFVYEKISTNSFENILRLMPTSYCV